MSKCRFHGLRRSFAVLASAVVSIFLAHSVPAQSADTNHPAVARKPCIILIVGENIGYGDLGCYGQTRIKTPNLDKLAARGMRFTDFYAGSSVAAPSREALLTGKHTGHTAIRGENGVASLPSGEPTLADLLRKAGFRTAAFGVWGLGDVTASVPSSRGFIEWFGYLTEGSAENYYPEFLNRSQLIESTGEKKEKLVSVDENASGKKGKYSDDYFMETAMKFMELAKPESYNNQRPFFLYLPFTIARANVALGKQTGNGMEVPDAASYSGESWPPAEKNKAAMITRLDDYVGVLMKKLEGYKIDRNTIIIFTSTAGPHKEGGVDPAFFNSAGPLRGAKRDLNEGAIRVPLIVSWPARVKAGGVSDLPCASWDIFPTAADIVKAPAPGETDGISLLPALTGQTQTNRHEFLYWELHEPTFKQAVRMGDWKIVRSTFDGPPELYNLKTDPGEKTNVAGKNPDVVMKISSYLRTARTDDKNWPASGADQTAQK